MFFIGTRPRTPSPEVDASIADIPVFRDRWGQLQAFREALPPRVVPPPEFSDERMRPSPNSIDIMIVLGSGGRAKSAFTVNTRTFGRRRLQGDTGCHHPHFPVKPLEEASIDHREMKDIIRRSIVPDGNGRVLHQQPDQPFLG